MTEQADFRALLAEDRCWDAGVQAAFEATGEPRVDAILQNREELIRLCEQLTVLQIRSFLEIGVWTGKKPKFVDVTSVKELPPAKTFIASVRAAVRAAGPLKPSK